jgi:hypothetical protein
MKALLGIAAALALCSCMIEAGTGFGGDDGSGGGGGIGGGGVGGDGGGNIAPGLQPASALASRSDPDVKAIGDACVKAESDWQQSCGCSLRVMFDLTKPNYTHTRLFNDDQRLMVKYTCEDISDNIKRVCNTTAADMCKMSTLNLRRVDIDQLHFTVTGSTGEAQLNWDDFRTDMDAISFVLTGARR